MKHVNLTRIFGDRCGAQWTVSFKGKESFTYIIPRILPEETIQRIRDRLEFNRRNNRRDIKNKYVLSEFTRCEHCDKTLSGQTQTQLRKGVEYEYKYYAHFRGIDEKCKTFSNIALEPIERAVFETIFENITDVPSFERAIAESMPDAGMMRQEAERIYKTIKVSK